MYAVFLKYYQGWGERWGKDSDQVCLKVVSREKFTASLVPC